MNKVYEYVTERIIKAIENGGDLPWRKPWNSAGYEPTNGVSMKAYRGVNNILLNYSAKSVSPYWFTFNQINSLGGKIRKGEPSEMVVFFKIMVKNNELENPKTWPFLRYTNVWNLSQIEFPEDVLSKYETKEKNSFVPIERAEEIVKNFRDDLGLKFGGDRAYYSLAFDTITLPNKETFNSNEEYYSTLFHEMVHFTGSEKRLKRFNTGDGHIFGSETYSREELVAEIGASMLMAHCRLSSDNVFNNSVAYISSWKKRLTDDPTLIVTAASRASKAVDYILGNDVTETTAE